MTFNRYYTILTIFFVLSITAGFVYGIGDIFIIDDIKIEGLLDIDEEMVLAALKVNPGDVFNMEELSTTIRYDLKRLHKLKSFGKMSAYLRPRGEDHYALIFKVEERPMISEIVINGADEISEDDIRDEISISSGERYNPTKLYSSLSAIKEKYLDKGYRQVEVSEDIVSDDLKIRIVIDIKEGRKITIRDISFIGNDHISEWELRNKVMDTKEDKFYNTKTLDMEVFEEDLEKIESRYRDKGFLDAEVADYEIKDVSGEDQIDIIIKIDEGVKYIVERIEVRGVEKIEEEKIRELVELEPDDEFSQEELDKTITNIMSTYYNKGYIFSDVEEIIERDEETGKTNIILNVKEGEKAKVDKIIITGNTTTKDTVIRRELRLYPGDTYSEAKLMRSLQRIFNLGYFSNVERDFVTYPEKNNVDLIIRIAEKPGTLKLNFGAGYSTIDGLVGQIQASWINFDVSKLPYIWRCKGGGQQLDFSTEFGKRRFNFMISFTEPWLLGKPILFGFDLYKSRYVRTLYDENKYGGSIRFGKSLSEYVYGRISYKIEVVDVVSDYAEEDLPDFLVDQLGRETTSSVTFNISRDSKDNIFFPSEGSDAGINFEIAGGPILGGSSDFYKISGHTSWYFHMFWKNVLALNFSSGIVRSYGDTEEVPIYERFYLGGARTVRGYGDWDIGPQDMYGNAEGGTLMFYSNLEYRIPIVENKVYALAFWDTGYNWRDIDYFNFKDLKSGLGGGIRFDIPMLGFMGFDYGYSISEKHGKLHFSFGRTF